MKNPDELKTWISTELAGILECKPDDIDPDQEFSSLGIDSLVAFAMTGDLSERIGKDLSATLLWEYPTINSLSQKVSDIVDDEPTTKKSNSNAVLLAGNGSRENLFCICGIELYQALADKLTTNMDTYGVYVAPEKALGKFNEDMTQSYDYHQVEELANRYVDEITQVQAEGPYHLLG
ncbi:MAG: phosphopantetheine-binding protein, partial [Desulfobulbia bacterium]